LHVVASVAKGGNIASEMGGAVRSDLTPVIIDGEPVSLREMVRNLVENAQTHAPGEVSIDLRDEADGIVLLVRDRGPGIPNDMRERVFERFERAGSSRPGSGLGLPIARNVARAMGGTIAVSEREGGGLEVTVRLPSSARNVSVT
jgi:two-component system sensor histidine kinase TctE